MADQGRATGIVELHRHQPRRHLHDVGLQPELDQSVCGLEPEQPAADDRSTGSRVGGGPDRLEVLDRPVDEAPGQVAPRHGRHERRGTRRQHQHVVGDHLAVRQGDLAGLAVQRIDPVPQQQAHPRVVVLAGWQQRELVRALGGEEAGECHPVVRRARLLTHHHDVVALGEPTFDRSLDEPVADHAVAGHDQRFAEVGHRVVLSGCTEGRCRMCWGGFTFVTRVITLVHGPCRRAARGPSARSPRTRSWRESSRGPPRTCCRPGSGRR